jgi:hypothetical protein
MKNFEELLENNIIESTENDGSKNFKIVIYFTDKMSISSTLATIDSLAEEEKKKMICRMARKIRKIVND